MTIHVGWIVVFVASAFTLAICAAEDSAAPIGGFVFGAIAMAAALVAGGALK